MSKVALINQENKTIGEIELREDVFGVEVNVPLVHQVLKAQLAGLRQGTAKTKTKAEVRGGGRKPFKQKGSGNARQGSSRSPLHPGGGQTFGPVPRSYAQATPKEMIRGALRSVLSDRLKSERLLVLDEWRLESHRTKEFVKLMQSGLKLDQVLMIDQSNPNLERASRNVPRVKFLKPESLNVYDVIRNEWIILTQSAIRDIESRLAPKRKIEENHAKVS